MGPSCEILEHTAEVQVRVRAPSLGMLAAEAGRALTRIELGEAVPPASGEWRRVELRARDREALLVDWLNELIYLAEAERWVAVEFRAESASDTALTMLVQGASVADAPARVKAATFHGLHVADRPDGLEAEIVLDV
jgi:SHS2 domain-containing protein